MASSNSEKKYVYNLPWLVRKQLCRILDQSDRWEDLAASLEYDTLTILELRRNKSPADALLELWDQKNPTIQELFSLLAEMEHYRAMLILKEYGSSSDGHYGGGSGLGYSGDRPLHMKLPTSITIDVPEELHAMIPENYKSVMPPVSEKATVTVNKALDIEDNLNMSKTSNVTPSKLMFPMTGSKIVNGIRHPLEGAGRPSLDVRESNTPPLSSHRRLSNASSVAENCNTIPKIEYSELVKATNDWHESNILGRGGFGTVFKGIWKNTQVAIKRMEQKGGETNGSNQVLLQQSLTELNILNSHRHDNILPLYGYSVGGSEPCLIYQFMPNGSLEDRLLCRDGTPPLTWTQRHAIAEGAARGLQFLHNSSKPFIHGDIKSANILLDLNFVPRIGDFGLAREGPQSQYTHLTVSRVHGTRPYLPEEFMRNKQVSVKVDTYSFGIVLFEIATGLRAYNKKRSKRYLLGVAQPAFQLNEGEIIRKRASIIWPAIPGGLDNHITNLLPTDSHTLYKEHVESCCKEQWSTLMDTKPVPQDPHIFELLLLLGISCVHKQPRSRPNMEKVLKSLETKNAGSSTSMASPQYNPFLNIPDNIPKYSATGGGLTLAIPSPYYGGPASPSNQQGLSASSQPPLPFKNQTSSVSSQPPFPSPNANLQACSINSQLPASLSSPSPPCSNNLQLPLTLVASPSINLQGCSPTSLSSQNDKQQTCSVGDQALLPLVSSLSPSPLSSPKITVLPPSQHTIDTDAESYAVNISSSSQINEDLPLLSILGIKDDPPNYTGNATALSDVASS